MKRTFATFVASIAVLALSSCGDPTDKPEDCSGGEYFDQVRKLCFTCPALREPDCAPGCGFAIETDSDRGCPEAVCIASDVCDLCPDRQFFSSESLQCEPCQPVEGCDNGEPVVAGDTCTLRCD